MLHVRVGWPGQDRGFWRKTKVHIRDDFIYQLIREGKWPKPWLMIKKCLQRVALDNPLDYKELQSDKGLINQVFDINMSCRLFLKVMHLTLEPWILNMDPEVWI